MEALYHRLILSCTLYLDSAGDPGWPKPFGKSHVAWYVLGGITLTPENDVNARKEIDRILGNYISPQQRRKYPPKYYEIHYRDIIGGNNVYDALPPIQRKALSDEIFSLIDSLKPILFATAIDKLKLKRKYGSNAYFPKDLAVRATIHRFSMYLKSNGLIGSIMMDTEEYRKDTLLRAMINEFHTTGIVLRGMSYQPRYEDRLEHVVNAITFSESETSSGIQLADVVCRSAWQHFERNKSNRFGQLSALWNRDASRVYEPSIFPK